MVRSVPVKTLAYRQSRIRWVSLGLGLGALQAVLAWATPAFSAERIVVAYGAFERSILVSDLETFAADGTLSNQLAIYAGYLNLSDRELEQLRQILTQPVDLDVVAVSQFLYTPQGKYLLKQLSTIIRTPARQSGFSSLRAALILAAADKQEGLTLLNILRCFPVPSIRVDAARGLQVTNEIRATINQSNEAMALVQGLSLQESVTQPLPDTLNTPGSRNRLDLLLNAPTPHTWSAFTLPIGRDGLPVDIYVPEQEYPAQPYNAPFPVVVISHGLGSDRTSFAYLAQYLATQGFVVITLEHPGSNSQQLLNLLEGEVSSVVADDEFTRRPMDVTYTLNQLEQQVRTNPRLQGRVDMSRIGVLGQSFGGYTALALAGAPIDRHQLLQRCPPAGLTLNLSLLLQCQAQTLGQDELYLGDPRIKAAIAVNPIDSAVFGPSSLRQIQIPVMLIAGGADTVAPALPEQIIPFTWLQTANRYLVLMKAGTHFSTIGSSSNGGDVLPLPEGLIGPAPELAQNYLKVLSLAFFQTYLNESDTYSPWLSAAFVQTLSQEPIDLSLVRQLTPDELQMILQSTVSPL